MINLVPDPFPEEDVRETPEETEKMSRDIVTKRADHPGAFAQVVVKHVDEQGEDAADEEGVDVAHDVVVGEEEVVHDVVVHAPGASPKGYN